MKVLAHTLEKSSSNRQTAGPARDNYIHSLERSTMPPKASKPASGKAQRSAIEDVVAREYTIHLHKRVRSV
jgi:hypothetical protein